MFAVNTKIGEITSQPEFQGYAYMTGKFPGIGGVFSGMMKLSTMAKIVGWTAQSMADGMNYLSTAAKKNKVFMTFTPRKSVLQTPARS